MTDHPQAALRDVLLGRLAESGLPAPAQDLLRELLPEARARGGTNRTGTVYLRSVTAAGWRGIGPAATLELPPGPGLTVVAGRNGSGKSSFAEAAEMALTGDNARWHGRTKIWKQGWRNLHDHRAPQVSVELSVDGEREPVTVRRTWQGEDVDDSTAVVERPGRPPVRLEEFLDPEALSLYRPFLSYSELGAMLNKPLSALHDALARILGLELLRDTDKRVLALRRTLNETVSQYTEMTRAVLAELEAHDDPRAAEAAAALRARHPDLDRVRALLKGHPAEDGGDLARLRRLAGIEGPDLAELRGAVARLRQAAARAENVREGTAENARRLSELLRAALDHRRRHPGSADCPVCGSAGRLDEAWAADAREQIARLTTEAAEAEAAHRGLDAAVRAVRDLVHPVPGWLQAESSSLADRWREWAVCRGISDPAELAERVERAAVALDVACHQAREDAAGQLADRDSRWQGLAVRLGDWLAAAEAAEDARPRLRHVKAAREWLRTVTDELRDARLKPFADASQRVWRRLCERSSVTLGAISLAGTANQGKVVLDVSVDDIDAPAYSVMSQGELHSLALSLFVPRAAHHGSPFGFLVIDDPVQSMDPEKVEGLARVLDEYARTRQVVVFTHDTRLQQAISHLGISATVREVSRQTDSVVRVVPVSDPVTQALGEAWSVASDDRLPRDVAERVLPAMCRGVLEAAYLQAARRRLRDERLGHLAAEQETAKAHSLVEVAALAIFGTRDRASEVLGAVAREHGAWARTLIQLCNAGSHEALPPMGEPRELVRATQQLARAVQHR